MSFSTKHHGDSVSGALGKWCCWNKPGLGDRGASLVVRLVKNLPAMRETWVHPWVGKIPFRRERLPTPVFWPGDFHGLYISWGCKESDMTARLSLKKGTVTYLLQPQGLGDWPIRTGATVSSLKSWAGLKWCASSPFRIFSILSLQGQARAPPVCSWLCWFSRHERSSEKSVWWGCYRSCIRRPLITWPNSSRESPGWTFWTEKGVGRAGWGWWH